jgi:hypothetical protein
MSERLASLLGWLLSGRMRRSRPPAVEQVHGFLAPVFRHVVVIHRGVDKRLKPLLTAGACEVAGGAWLYHVLSTLI